MSSITVVDYGVGNLFSVRRAIEKCGASVTFAGTAAEIGAAQRLLLPGVGAFQDGMSGLRERGLIDAVRAFADTGRPLLGICLGMQMLLTKSEEFGEHAGLGIIPGRVVAIPATTANGEPHKIPFVGWCELERPAAAEWSGTVLEDLRPGAAVYLVHSYGAVPDEAGHRLADYDYDGRSISAAIRAGNVSGCQFHPEMSGTVGLSVLARFLHS